MSLSVRGREAGIGGDVLWKPTRHNSAKHFFAPPPNGEPPTNEPGRCNNDSNSKTADLEELNAPQKGFLWHLRRAFNPKERGRDGDVGTAAATAVRYRGEREGGAGGRGEGEQEEDRQGREEDAGNEEATTMHVGNGTKNQAVVVVLPIHGEKELAGYTGGYTVQRHARSRAGEGAVVQGRPTQAAVEKGEEESRRGSNRGSLVVDAVQLEFGTSFRRTPEARANAAEAVACAIFNHLQQGQTNWTP